MTAVPPGAGVHIAGMIPSNRSSMSRLCHSPRALGSPFEETMITSSSRGWHWAWRRTECLFRFGVTFLKQKYWVFHGSVNGQHLGKIIDTYFSCPVYHSKEFLVQNVSALSLWEENQITSKQRGIHFSVLRRPTIFLSAIFLHFNALRTS